MPCKPCYILWEPHNSHGCAHEVKVKDGVDTEWRFLSNPLSCRTSLPGGAISYTFVRIYPSAFLLNSPVQVDMHIMLVILILMTAAHQHNTIARASGKLRNITGKIIHLYVWQTWRVLLHRLEHICWGLALLCNCGLYNLLNWIAWPKKKKKRFSFIARASHGLQVKQKTIKRNHVLEKETRRNFNWNMKNRKLILVTVSQIALLISYNN